MGSTGSSILEPELFQTFNQDMTSSTVPVVASVFVLWILQPYESAALKNLDRFKWNQCGIKKTLRGKSTAGRESTWMEVAHDTTLVLPICKVLCKSCWSASLLMHRRHKSWREEKEVRRRVQDVCDSFQETFLQWVISFWHLRAVDVSHTDSTNCSTPIIVGNVR